MLTINIPTRRSNLRRRQFSALVFWWDFSTNSHSAATQPPAKSPLFREILEKIEKISNHQITRQSPVSDSFHSKKQKKARFTWFPSTAVDRWRSWHFDTTRAIFLFAPFTHRNAPTLTHTTDNFWGPKNNSSKWRKWKSEKMPTKKNDNPTPQKRSLCRPFKVAKTNLAGDFPKKNVSNFLCVLRGNETSPGGAVGAGCRWSAPGTGGGLVWTGTSAPGPGGSGRRRQPRVCTSSGRQEGRIDGVC